MSITDNGQLPGFRSFMGNSGSQLHNNAKNIAYFIWNIFQQFVCFLDSKCLPLIVIADHQYSAFGIRSSIVAAITQFLKRMASIHNFLKRIMVT